MKKIKKIILGLGTISTVAIPVVAVVSCSGEDTVDKTYIIDHKGQNGEEAYWLLEYIHSRGSKSHHYRVQISKDDYIKYTNQ